MIGQCLTELKTHLSWIQETFVICNQTFVYNKLCLLFVDLCDLATTYYRVSRISLPLRTVRRKFKLIKEIVREDEDFVDEWLAIYVK